LVFWPGSRISFPLLTGTVIRGFSFLSFFSCLSARGCPPGLFPELGDYQSASQRLFFPSFLPRSWRSPFFSPPWQPCRGVTDLFPFYFGVNFCSSVSIYVPHPFSREITGEDFFLPPPGQPPLGAFLSYRFHPAGTRHDFLWMGVGRRFFFFFRRDRSSPARCSTFFPRPGPTYSFSPSPDGTVG